MFLKLVKGKEVISPSSYLDVLKIMVKMRENDLYRQIYPYLKIDLQQIIKKKKNDPPTKSEPTSHPHSH